MATQQVPYTDPQDTKESILLASTKLFAQQGYDGTSIRDITEAARVTKPVLYYYFKSKEDLYINLINDAYAFFFTEIRAVIQTSQPFLIRLKQLIHLYISCHEMYEDTVRIIYNAAFGSSRNHPKVNIQKLEEEHIELLTKFFQEGVHEKVLRKIPLQSIVMHYIGLVTANTNYRLIHLNNRIQNSEKQILDLFLQGTGAKQI